MIPHYTIKHLAGPGEELSCFSQLEDESAALYFNIVHGAKVRRRFTTASTGTLCADYILIAREDDSSGNVRERAIELFDAA